MRASLAFSVPMLGALLFAASSAFPADPRRGYVAGRFAIELDGGTSMGFLQSASGGGVTADVVESPDPTNPLLVTKQIGRPKYEDITVQLGLADAGSMSDWIGSMLEGKPTRRSGRIIAADFNFEEVGRLGFSDALITELGIPACDAAAKDPAYMTLKITPETSTWTITEGRRLDALKGGQQKTWLPSNFRLQVGDLPCSRVSKIDAFTIKMQVNEEPDDQQPDRQKEPTKLEFPNLAFTLADYSQEWQDWHDEFVIQGKNGNSSELGGVLTFLAPDLKTELMSLELQHVGILSVSRLPERSVDPKDPGRQFIVRVYVERIRLINPK